MSSPAEVAIVWQTSRAYHLARGLGDRYGRIPTVYLCGQGIEFTPRMPKPLPLVVAPIGQKLLRRIAKLQDGRCYLCDRAMSAPTREHVVPKASRPPRPCEMLYLDAVYLRLGVPERTLSLSQPEPMIC